MKAVATTEHLLTFFAVRLRWLPESLQSYPCMGTLLVQERVRDHTALRIHLTRDVGVADVLSLRLATV